MKNNTWYLYLHKRSYVYCCIFIYVSLVRSQVSNIQQALHTMSLEQKIAQLLMPAVWLGDTSTKSIPHQSMQPKEVESIIKEHEVGGIIFLGNGTIEQQQSLIQRYQHMTHIPLLIGLDAEWGLRMRLQDAILFPKNITLSAIPDEKLLYAFGKEIGKQCKALGIHINFAPVVDINNNLENPIINTRSFGDNRDTVTRAALPIMRGLQQSVIACAKHFPGHGNTTIDSHASLPHIALSQQQLSCHELYPFKQLIKAGIHSIMVGHLLIPSYDAIYPASLSYRLTTELLRHKLSFEGLIITDALNMGALTQNIESHLIGLQAFLAGADLLVCPIDVAQTIKSIKHAIQQNIIAISELDRRVEKILRLKQKIKIAPPTDAQTVKSRLFAKKVYQLQQKLYQQAVTNIQSKTVNTLPTSSFIVIQVGTGTASLCTDMLQAHNKVEQHYIIDNSSNLSLLEKCIHNKSTIICVYSTNNKSINAYVNYLSSKSNVTLVLFCSPFSLKYFTHAKHIILGYEAVKPAEIQCARIILGQDTPKGILPITRPT